jgi:hypothetical protein
MRVWDLNPEKMCMQHLVGEHRELHGAWKIIREGKKGYSKHPETIRWVGKLDALKVRHDRIVGEIRRRKPNSSHKTDLPWVGDCKEQDQFVDSIENQIQNVRDKGCDCQF